MLPQKQVVLDVLITVMVMVFVTLVNVLVMHLSLHQTVGMQSASTTVQEEDCMRLVMYLIFSCNNNTGVCYCFDPENVSGQYCQNANYSCPNDCCGNGVCNTGTGQCACFAGYEGEGCCERKCPSDCSGNGNCDVTTGVCNCTEGYAGANCALIDCIGGCGNSTAGACDYRNGTCVCTAEFTGTNCDESILYRLY